MALDLDALTLGPVRSVAELMSWNEQFQAGRFLPTPRYWAFRGHPHEFKNLAPSFARSFSSNSHGAVELIERELIKNFREHYALLPDRSPDMPLPAAIADGNDLRCLSVMQHYEVPTRLLDWTSDLWIAAYFACATEPSEHAELWLYDRQLLSSGVDVAARRADVEARVGAGSEPATYSQRAERLLVELDPRLTPRMKRQSAHHTVAANVFEDHAQLLNDLAASANAEQPDSWYFRRLIIDRSCKGNVLKFLADHKMVTASTLFPDVVGLGRFLKWQFESLRTMLL